MDKGSQTEKVKRTQSDYSLAFKLLVVSEQEQGELSNKQTQKKSILLLRNQLNN